MVLRPRRNGRGAGARSGRARSVDRVGPSVEAAGEAADVAMSGTAHWIDSQIAGAAVGAAIGSAGRGRAAPQTAVRHASARDRHGRGTRIQCPVPYWSRVSRAHVALNAASRPWFALTVRIMRSGARLLVFLSGAMAGAGWALPTVRLCGPLDDDPKLLISQIPHSGGGPPRWPGRRSGGSSAFVQKPVLSLCDA